MESEIEAEKIKELEFDLANAEEVIEKLNNVIDEMKTAMAAYFMERCYDGPRDQYRFWRRTYD